ncbi:(Fe-S)-binding protein [bacterium]|nr:(Fe-S)-binding protein [bacterium]
MAETSRENGAGDGVSVCPPEPRGTQRRFVDTAPLLACVHCGLCQDACPTYVETGREADSPRGRIHLVRALEEGRIEPTTEVTRHLDACLGCLACETACPSGVPYGTVIGATRPWIEDRRPAAVRAARRALASLLVHPVARRIAFAPLRAVGGASLLARAARRLHGTRAGSLLAFAAAVPPARGTPALPGVVEPVGTPRGTALFLPGCVAETLFPETARATVGLLAAAGVRVRVAHGSGCCGALPHHLGRADDARARLRALLRSVGGERVDWILPSAAGCGAHLREAGHLLAEEPAAGALAAKTIDPLVLLARLGLPEPRRRIAETVAVHDPCHLVHGQGVREEPRALLRAVCEKPLVPLRESELCCGSAGTYNLTEPDMAARLLERKIDAVVASGAQVVAAANPGCLVQVRSGALSRGIDVRVEHPLDLLARAHLD